MTITKAASNLVFIGTLLAATVSCVQLCCADSAGGKAGHKIKLVADNVVPYDVVVAADASPQVRELADTLANYLQRINEHFQKPQAESTRKGK